MSLVHADWVEETTTTTGTGTLDLAGATTGNRTFVAGIGDTNTCIYGIHASNGNFESGIGTVTDAATDTLSRDTLIASSTGSKLNLPVGTHTVYCTMSEKTLEVHEFITAPAGPSSTGTPGQWAWSSPYLYFCVATDTWVRTIPARTWS